MVQTLESSLGDRVGGCLWRLAGLWPGASRRRLWLPEQPNSEQEPEFKLVVCAIVRNEAHYLAEWIEFHRMMGVEHFYLYDNGSDDGTQALLKNSPHSSRITLIDWTNFLSGWEGVSGPGGRMQRMAMLHCIANFGSAAEWIAFIDVDEFMYPAKATSLLDVLADYDDLSSLSVFWNLFGTSGLTVKPDKCVTEAYTSRRRTPAGPDKNLCRVKSIVRPRAVRGVHNTHVLVLQNGYPQSWTEQRAQIGYNDTRPDLFSDGVIRLNHYFTKSLAEYRSRQDAPAEGRRNDFRANDKLFNLIESDCVEDIAIQRFVPELKRRLKRGRED